MKFWKIACWICILFTLVITSCQKDKDLLDTANNHITSQGHTHSRNCGSMHLYEKQMNADPKMATRREAIERQIEQFKLTAESRTEGIVTIPVVVHIVYNTEQQNISQSQIESQMKVLNDDFRRLNADKNNNWSQAADIEVEFCLATIDPNGNATNGVTRTSTTVTEFGVDNDQIKSDATGGKSPWSPSEYLNMWVGPIESGILGYAQFPGGPAATDGVVMGYQYFGTEGTATAPFNLGRTTTHEVGHYLNLFHIWGDGPCGEDDLVEDTPESDAANYGCESGHVSCGSADMVENYMDYSDDACMNLFTEGQKTRMRALFAAGGARASLVNSGKCGGGGGGNPPTATCNDGIQNGNETGVDCGGSCPPCEVEPTCNDGIQNGDETGVDCGGSCPPCEAEPTCNDGIQNGDEEGVDCGGTFCEPCDTTDPDPTPCGEGSYEVTLLLQPDDFGSEITWEVIDDYGDVIAFGGPYDDFDDTLIEEAFCVPDEGCFEFVIYDAWGDGICCDYGYGYYELIDEDGYVMYESDGQYGFFESTLFCFFESQGLKKKESKKDTKAESEILFNHSESGNAELNIQNAKKGSSAVILNASGNVVKTLNFQNQAAAQKTDLNSLPNGNYIIQYGKKGKLKTERISIRK